MELNELRNRIDDVDEELITLLERRMDVSAQIAEWKQQRGFPVLDADREAAKLEGLKNKCRPETADLIADVFRAVMSSSRAHQEKMMEKRDG